MSAPSILCDNDTTRMMNSIITLEVILSDLVLMEGSDQAVIKISSSGGSQRTMMDLLDSRRFPNTRDRGQNQMVRQSSTKTTKKQNSRDNLHTLFKPR